MAVGTVMCGSELVVTASPVESARLHPLQKARQLMLPDSVHDLISKGEACCVCGRTEASVWRLAPDNLMGGERQFTAVRCAGCATVRLQPRPLPEEMGDYYTASTYARAEDDKSELAHRLDEFFSHQANRATTAFGPDFRGSRMLDVGCGDGRFLKAMAARGWSGEGIETDSIAAGLARERSGATIYETPLENTPFAEATFDLVSLLHVLEHVPNPRQTLSTAYRLLRPGGKLLLALPNVRCVEASLFGRSWYPLDLPRHYWGFRQETLVRLAEECGFVAPALRYLPFMFAPQSLRYVARSGRGVKAASTEKRSEEPRAGGGKLQTRLFLALLNASEQLGLKMPGEVMELTATRPFNDHASGDSAQ